MLHKRPCPGCWRSSKSKNTKTPVGGGTVSTLKPSNAANKSGVLHKTTCIYSWSRHISWHSVNNWRLFDLQLAYDTRSRTLAPNNSRCTASKTTRFVSGTSSYLLLMEILTSKNHVLQRQAAEAPFLNPLHRWMAWSSVKLRCNKETNLCTTPSPQWHHVICQAPNAVSW